MEIESIKITDLKPAEYNPRRINDDEYLKLKNSISTFGLVDPIIINLKNMHIVGGHQRYDALLDMSMEDNEFFKELSMIRMGDVGFVFTDTDLSIEDEDHEKALNLALNKISGEWDNSKLSEVIQDLESSGLDLELTGFDELELDVLTDDFSDLFDSEDYEDYNTGDEDVPDDYVDVEGDSAGRSYIVIVSFPEQSQANDFLRYLDSPRLMDKESIQLQAHEINYTVSDSDEEE